MELSPPKYETARPSTGLFAFVGLAGVLSAIGAGASGFLTRLSVTGFVEYSWDNTLRYAAIFALVGGMLALSQHEVGIPIVIGSSATIVAVVGTVLASDQIELSDLLDRYPVRGVLFVGAGIVSAFGIVVGLAGLRGRSNPGFGVPVALLTLISLGMTAAILRLDETRHAEQVRPFIGFVFIGVLCVVCSFAGRYGVFGAAVAAATIISLFIDTLEVTDRRQPAVVANIIALALIITLGTTALAAVSRRDAQADDVAYRWEAQMVTQGVPAQPRSPNGGYGNAGYSSGSSPAITAPTAVAPAPRATYEGPPPKAARSLPTTDFAATADQLLSGHPLIAPYEPTTAVPQQSVYEPTTAVQQQSAYDDTGAVSTIGQWAPDPYGRHHLRYWDGASWTEHVRNNGVPTTDPV